MTRPTLSFEFFPPRSDAATKRMDQIVPELASLDPLFMSVTYGAGGSTKEKTLDTANHMHDITKVPVATHLTYINTPRKDLYVLTDELWNNGIQHIVALRGDMPKDLNWPLDPDEDYFQYTSHFVAALKARHDFEVSVGAYPEKHPDAPSLDADIEALKKKCDAGADRAITQFFFENDTYYRFLEETQKAGIKKPVVPGILPINEFDKMCRFAKSCQTAVPDWISEKYNGLDSKSEEARKIAIDILVTQLRDLIDQGVPHIHIYTLNRADIIEDAIQQL